MTPFVCTVCGVTEEHFEPSYVDLEFIWHLGNVSIHHGVMCNNCARRAYGFAEMLATAVTPNDTLRLIVENQRLKTVNKRLMDTIQRNKTKHHE